MGTHLIYQQIVRGIKFGEYRCDKAEDLAELAAQQVFVDYGRDVTVEKVGSVITSYVPDGAIVALGMDKWINAVFGCFKMVRLSLCELFS